MKKGLSDPSQNTWRHPIVTARPSQTLMSFHSGESDMYLGMSQDNGHTVRLSMPILRFSVLYPPSAEDGSMSEQSINSLNLLSDQNSTNSGVNSHVGELVSQPVSNQSQGETQTASHTTQQHTPQVTPPTIIQPERVGRSQRLRQPPDRYGEWVMPIFAQNYNDCKKEVHIYYV
ncbi:hypothetical protein DPMN_193412 [Dreissena polymorpha]|uniref:Uncharacterized protein n=1 Tax=Dreissena polymorpha TaxID=45954 RepID=A0A9D3Y6D1_DREPO|nr:hypothetical protein DPMN_193412 [Dreissena polymorpha]